MDEVLLGYGQTEITVCDPKIEHFAIMIAKVEKNVKKDEQ